MGKFHAEKYSLIPEVELVGVADLVSSRAREVAQKWGTRAFSDFRELLPIADAVSIVVPTDQHYPVGKAFLSAGKDVLLEKPMTATLEEAEDLIATAEKNSAILQVGHVERFNPAILAARKRIRAPLFIMAERLTPFRGRGIEVDVVLDLMIHDLDIILDLVGFEVVECHAAGAPVITGKADVANVRLEFAGGCVANLTASRIASEDQRRFRVFQPDTYVSVDYAAKRVTLYRRIIRKEEERPQIISEPVEVPPGDSLENEIRSFVRSSMTRTPPTVSGRDGRRALALALEINKRIQANMERIPSVMSFYAARNDRRESSG